MPLVDTGFLKVLQLIDSENFNGVNQMDGYDTLHKSKMIMATNSQVQ